MKRTPTNDPDIVRYSNGIYYFKRGHKEFSLKTKDFKEAVKKKRLLEPRLGDLIRMPIKFKVKDAVPLFLESRKKDVESGSIREKSYKILEDNFRLYLLPYFGEMRLAAIDSLAWDGFKREHKHIKLFNPRKYFYQFLRWCKKSGYLSDVPFLDLNDKPSRRRRILTIEELRRIWENSSGNLRVFLSMAIFMGMRRKEIMTMRWENIDFRRGYMRITSDFSKTKRSREITMHPEVMRILNERYEAQRKLGATTPWVFPNAKDPRKHADLGGLKTAWNTCKKRAFGSSKEDVTWHDLRATCETFAHKRSDLTDSQLEAYFGANIAVQRRIYVQLTADDVRGVESSIPLLATKEIAD